MHHESVAGPLLYSFFSKSDFFEKSMILQKFLYKNIKTIGLRGTSDMAPNKHARKTHKEIIQPTNGPPWIYEFFSKLVFSISKGAFSSKTCRRRNDWPGQWIQSFQHLAKHRQTLETQGPQIFNKTDDLHNWCEFPQIENKTYIYIYIYIYICIYRSLCMYI